MFKYIFDYKYYINEYPDIINQIHNEKDAWMHYIEYGINENRRCINSKLVIDPDFYINYYPDLIQANITTYEQALSHWYRHGMFEMRYGKKKNNLDLSYEEFINNSFPKFLYDQFYLNNNLLDYIKKYSLKNNDDYKNHHIINNLYNTTQKKNCIHIDLKFYKYVNNLPYNDLYILLEHLHNDGLFGLIYSPFQLKNIFPTIQIYEFDNELYCEDNKSPMLKLHEFVNINLYNKSFNELANLLIKSYENTISENINFCILLFIGDEKIGNDIINMLSEYKKYEIFNLGICFNSYNLYNKLKNTIFNTFNNYKLYVSNECGNDIIPTILMYDNLYQDYKPLHIIKLQTKSSLDIMNDLTKYLLTKPLNQIISELNSDTNTVGNPSYYMKLENDFFNKHLYNKYKDILNMNKKFVIATIFYISGQKMTEVTEFVKKNNYKAFLLNNMYDSNRIVIDRSHVHFLERLFGVI